MRREQASEAARMLVEYRWQKTNEHERSDMARKLAESRWEKQTAAKRRVEAEREREIKNELTHA
jgi:hypothetical protein